MKVSGELCPPLECNCLNEVTRFQIIDALLKQVPVAKCTHSLRGIASAPTVVSWLSVIIFKTVIATQTVM